MHEGTHRKKESVHAQGAEEGTRIQKGGEAATTRLGMKDGTETQDHASDPSEARSAEDGLAAKTSSDRHQRKADEVAEELGDFA